MESADAVGRRADARGQEGHVEALVRVRWILTAVAQQPIERDAKPPAKAPKILGHQRRLIEIEARRDGRVGREQVARGGKLAGLEERQPELLHQRARSLETQKRGVPFIHVADRRGRIPSAASARMPPTPRMIPSC